MSSGLRWVGGANVPGTMLGRVNATRPLGVLTLSETRLQLRVRPRLFSFGAVRLDVGPSDVNRVFAAYTRLVEGIAIENLTGDLWFFWCDVTPQILQACGGSGVPGHVRH